MGSDMARILRSTTRSRHRFGLRIGDKMPCRQGPESEAPIPAESTPANHGALQSRGFSISAHDRKPRKPVATHYSGTREARSGHRRVGTARRHPGQRGIRHLARARHPIAAMTPAPDSRVLYGRLLGYVKPYWRMFALSLVALVLTAATEPMLPALFKPLLDKGFVAKDQDFIRWIPILLLALFLVCGFFCFISSYCMAWVGSRLVMDLRATMFDKLMTLPTRYFDQNPSGQLIAHLAFNVTQVTQSATSSLTTLVRDTVTVLGLLGYLLWLNWQLTLIVFALVPLTLWVVRVASKRLRGLSRKAQQNIGDLTQVVDEAVGGHRVVKLYGGEDYELTRFREAANLARLFEMKRVAATAVYDPVIQLIAAIALAIIVYIAAAQASDTATTVGGFVAFVMAMLLQFAPLKRLTSDTDQLQRGLAAAETIFTMLDEDAERDSGTRTLERIEGRLALRDVA